MSILWIAEQLRSNILVNIHNNEIRPPNGVNAICNLTALFRLLMQQKAIRPANYEC